MSIEQRPNSGQVSPARKGKLAAGAGGLDATLNRISLNPARSLRLQIALGALALAWVVFVGALLLRPSAPPPEAVAALPPLAVALPPLAEVESNTIGEPPIQIGVPQEREPVPVKPDVSRETSGESAPSAVSPGIRQREKAVLPAIREAPQIDKAPLPPNRPAGFGPIARPAAGYDRSTAVYDISAHTVYLPDGTRLEAHSGLGDRLDNPRFVSERDRGPTPPGVYELTLRESLFHGVQALRLSPVGDDDVFGRSGLLAHPYMLGPNGDSNGCVSFKNYDTFLRAYQNGHVKRLAVVAEWVEASLNGRAEKLRRGLGD
jgi:Tlde1 domain